MIFPNKLSKNRTAKINKNPLLKTNSKENEKHLTVNQTPTSRPLDFLEEGITEGNQISIENLNSENDV
jgi:hypothetical protein